jgi:thiol:disulfide interchange protein
LQNLFAAVFLSISALSGDAATTQARLILSAETARPGDTVMAGVQLKMAPGWHTYWKNPGGPGIATSILWHLPPGVSAGEIQWPLPEKITVSNETSYVYDNEVVLTVPLKLAPDLKAGPLQFKAKVSWLECEIASCVPGSANVAARLELGGGARPSPYAGLIETWKKKVPQAAPAGSVKFSWEKPTSGDSRPLLIEWSNAQADKKTDFLPYAGENFEVLPATEIVSAEPGKVRLRKVVKKTEGDWPKQIAGVLTMREGGSALAYEVKSPISESSTATATATPTQSLWRMLLYAFIGGLILNIMPCVFPVIALKIFGFVQQSHDEPRRVFALGVIYGLGVLASFLVMAGLVIAIKQSGGSASWGMQFKNPQISVGFIALVVLIALNLFGVFEVNLGGRTMGAAGQLASKHGAAGALFNGVLATVLATPCTAPILASALGFAFGQPPLVVLLFFLTIGFGLAFPYVLLSWKPGWLKFLPRPGAWMENFKVAMGFPMLATAVWIFWFTAPRFGDDGVIWIGFFLIGLAFAAWIWGTFVQRGGRRHGLPVLISLGVILASYAYALESKLHWRSPVKASSAGRLQNDTDGVQWQPWSMDAVAKARSEGRPVLVDFTAKWCLTCNKFVKPAVDNRDVRRKLDEINGVALLADYTDYPEDISTELKKFHSDGAVPLVLVYSRDASQPPAVLPTIPSRKDVLDALTKAAQ